MKFGTFPSLVTLGAFACACAESQPVPAGAKEIQAAVDQAHSDANAFQNTQSASGENLSTS